MNFFTILLLVIGLILVIKGSDIFVSASSAIARNLHVSPLIIGLTIMAFGTSAPEAMIGISAAFSGASAIAVGNSVGSNLFNLVFIIGLVSVIKPICVDFNDIARDFFIALAAPTVLVMMFVLFNDYVPRHISGLLLLTYLIYLFSVIKHAKKERLNDDEEKATEINRLPDKPFKINVFFVLLGIIMVVAGGEIIVSNAITIASALGISQRIVGLTIISIGTSLPELIIATTAARKGEHQLVLGNIIGACLINIMFTLGISGVIYPITIDQAVIFDLSVLLFGMTLVFYFALTRKRISRHEGLALMGLYTAYLLFVTLG